MAGNMLSRWSNIFEEDGEKPWRNRDSEFEIWQRSTDELITLYPSAFITYSINDKNNLNFSYSRRVDRPSIGQVNPIREWSTPTVESIGNPNLTPQFTNSFEVSYSKTTKIGTITSNVFYRKIKI